MWKSLVVILLIILTIGASTFGISTIVNIADFFFFFGIISFSTLVCILVFRAMKGIVNFYSTIEMQRRERKNIIKEF